MTEQNFELEKFIFLNYMFHILLILFLLYLGWKIRKIYKSFIFFLYKRKGKKAEIKAINLLKKNGYLIVKEQPTANGILYENNKQISFSVRADLLVSKKDTLYVAEIKSGQAAFIQEINTRRQLLEYSKLFNSNKLILIDTNQNKIKEIKF